MVIGNIWPYFFLFLKAFWNLLQSEVNCTCTCMMHCIHQLTSFWNSQFYDKWILSNLIV